MAFSAEVRAGSHAIGPEHPPFVIAEMSGNHNGDLDRALAIVDAVAASGAQALKIQTYTADTITLDVDGPQFRVEDGHGLWGGRTLHQLYDEAHTPWDWHKPIFDRARDLGLLPFSSPFDPTAVDFLEGLGVELYKTASAEIVDLPLIRQVAAHREADRDVHRDGVDAGGRGSGGGGRGRGLHRAGAARVHRVVPG